MLDIHISVLPNKLANVEFILAIYNTHDNSKEIYSSYTVHVLLSEEEKVKKKYLLVLIIYIKVWRL